MEKARMISTWKLSLFFASIILGTSALMYAQEQREDSKPNETSSPAASKDEKTRDEKTRPAQEDKRGGTATPQDSRAQGARAPEQNEDRAVRGEDRSSHQQDNNSRMEQRTDRNTQSDRETNHETSNRDSRSERDNNHRGGGRIPEDQFKSHFGRQHAFIVSHPTVVGGQPQFQCGGYTFNVIGAWPADWSYSDEYYVDFINDDYVLFDLAHPGVSVAIVVVM